jgi:hypothetical protein
MSTSIEPSIIIEPSGVPATTDSSRMVSDVHATIESVEIASDAHAATESLTIDSDVLDTTDTDAVDSNGPATIVFEVAGYYDDDEHQISEYPSD